MREPQPQQPLSVLPGLGSLSLLLRDYAQAVAFSLKQSIAGLVQVTAARLGNMLQHCAGIACPAPLPDLMQSHTGLSSVKPAWVLGSWFGVTDQDHGTVALPIEVGVWACHAVPVQPTT